MKSLPILSIDIGEDAGDDCTTAITEVSDSDNNKKLRFIVTIPTDKTPIIPLAVIAMIPYCSKYFFPFFKFQLTTCESINFELFAGCIILRNETNHCLNKLH
jgi:hypothetical protein